MLPSHQIGLPPSRIIRKISHRLVRKLSRELCRTISASHDIQHSPIDKKLVICWLYRSGSGFKKIEAQIVLKYQLQIDQSESKVIALKVQLTFNH